MASTDNVLLADISLWNDKNTTAQRVNFQKAATAGLSGVFIKSSQANYLDEDFMYNWDASKDAGLFRTMYHFLTWTTSAVAQAQFFAQLWLADPGDFRPAVDFEWWSTVPSNAFVILWGFLQEFQRLTGINPLIYTAPGFWYAYGNTDPKWAAFDLWVAHWQVLKPVVPKPWTTWKFWQYTSKADGLTYGCESQYVDLNYFNGNLDAFKVYAGMVPAPLTEAEKLNRLWDAHIELH